MWSQAVVYNEKGPLRPLQLNSEKQRGMVESGIPPQTLARQSEVRILSYECWRECYEDKSCELRQRFCWSLWLGTEPQESYGRTGLRTKDHHWPTTCLQWDPNHNDESSIDTTQTHRPIYGHSVAHYESNDGEGQSEAKYRHEFLEGAEAYSKCAFAQNYPQKKLWCWPE